MRKRKSNRTEKKKPAGFYSEMSDDELLANITENHRGKSITEFRLDCWGAYDVTRERRFMDKLVKSGIIMRKATKRGFFSDMSDEELIDYITEKYIGRTLGDLHRNRAIYIARKRGLVDGLVKKGVLIRSHRYNFFLQITDEELIDYISRQHNGKKIIEFQEKDNRAYKTARERRLLDKLVENGVLVRKSRAGYFFRMEDGELIDYIVKTHKGKTLTEFSKDDSRAYEHARRRGLINNLLKEGVLLRLQNKSSTNIKERVIQLLTFTDNSYLEIARGCKIDRGTVLRITDKAIEEGGLDSEYRRPNGALYLTNVRSYSQKKLEEILE